MTPTIKAHIAAIALLAALPLGGCVVPPPTDDSSPVSVTSAPDESTDTADPEQTASASSSATQTQPDGVRQPIVPLTQFRGLLDKQVTDMLGTPQFQRTDSSVELWQYRGEDCVLHLFLYRSKDGLRVQHAEIRPRTMSGSAMSGPAAEACLAKLTAAPPAATS